MNFLAVAAQLIGRSLLNLMFFLSNSFRALSTVGMLSQKSSMRSVSDLTISGLSDELLRGLVEAHETLAE